MDIPNFNEMAQGPMAQNPMEQAPAGPPIAQPIGIPTDTTIGQPTGMPNGEGLSQEQMRSNLQEMMSKIQSKKEENDGSNLAVESRLKQANGEALRMVFDILRQNGVDPSNIESVGKFLEKIRTTDPEASAKLEEILGSLIGEEPEDNMNIINNDTTQQEI